MTPRRASLFAFKMMLVLDQVQEMSINLFNLTEGVKVHFIFKDREDFAKGVAQAQLLGADVVENPDFGLTFFVANLTDPEFEEEFDPDYWAFILDNEPSVVFTEEELDDYDVEWSNPTNRDLAADPHIHIF